MVVFPGISIGDGSVVGAVLAAARTRQLMKGAPALVDSTNRPAVTALREIAAGHVHWTRRSQEAVNEFIAERKANDR